MKKNELDKLAPAELLQEAISLNEQVEKLEAANKELTEQLEAAAADYAELSKKLDQAESGKAPKVFGEVKVDKTTYEIVRAKVIYRQAAYTAKDIIDNKELAAALVKIGASCLRAKA